MIPNVTKGNRVRGLLEYLFGPGTANEHTDPHVVAGYAPVDELQPAGSLESGFDLAGLAARLDAARYIADGREPKKFVWQCSLSLPPTEGKLGSQTWGRIAQRFAEEMGFANGPDNVGCRWVAVHHGASKKGNDHIHFVAVLVREDGRPFWFPRGKEFKRANDACDRLEDEFGLVKAVPARDKKHRRPPVSRAEYDRAHRSGKPVERVVLRREVRAAAAGATNELEFAARLHAAGLKVHTRTDAGGTVVGFAVALPDGDKLQWCSGSKLDADLSLPRLRQRWPDTTPATAAAWASATMPGPHVSTDQAAGLWPDVTKYLSDTADDIRTAPPPLEEASDVARGLSDLATLLAHQIEPRSTLGPLSAAADQLARATAPTRAPTTATPSEWSTTLVGLSRHLHRVKVGEKTDSILLATAVAAIHIAAAIAVLIDALSQRHSTGAAGQAIRRLNTAVKATQRAARATAPPTPAARKKVNTAFATTTNQATRTANPSAAADQQAASRKHRAPQREQGPER
ncbi:relaxase/mobilization nuclease domain-containing protein [Stackebrandtia nassauensis]|uniref:Relaxase/mobilization nuclease family protein n=1 Tax=Stackebrandtia nassauensis (strain DSM 44728 / CIP 108903 / NRRL B-16338 / NBRC 102104 / LLR-40K-21) TaxID=446470 RepID=D3Q2W0_STANL|nr:relaxase/mobilization nuclease domain-containing protein [Stackebrandtia nassauensis]ADD45861.1 Relaxase/mobilization nuclease family protein [Stackebrandtia nassauensis DSM 44728]